jgi:hypothetical protein
VHRFRTTRRAAPGCGRRTLRLAASRTVIRLCILATWAAAAVASASPGEPGTGSGTSRADAVVPMPPGQATSPTFSPAPDPDDHLGAASGAMDGREVFVPVRGAARIRIDNPLGNVTVRAWGRAESMHIVAEKRAASPDGLARLRVHFTAWASGEVSVETRVEMGGRERALPLIASGVDLLVELPADVAVEVKTFAGRISASGLRSATRLETTGGRIQISDIRGRVVTRQLRGGQSVAAVDGDLDLDGVEGQMRLDGVGGSRIEARIVDGDIRADDIRSDDVRLASTTGTVVLLGIIRPHAHYDLRSYQGDVRLGVAGAPAGFELRARSGLAISSVLNLRTLWRQADRMRAIASPVASAGMPVSAAGARSAEAEAGGGMPRPIVELTSVLGRVVLDAPQTLRAEQDNRTVRW